MRYQYIALINGNNFAQRDDIARARRVLDRDPGMVLLLSSGPLELYASKETPYVLIPGQGIIIGNLFSDDGTPLSRHDRLTAGCSSDRFEAHLLENYWGEYILFQIGTGKEGALNIFRDPSGGMACVYFLQEGGGFLTSDLSLTMSLELYTKQTDWSYIAHAVTYTFLRTERTGLVGVRELLPGCALSLRGSSVRSQCVWSPWDYVAPDVRHHDLHDAAAEVRDAISTVVKAWAGADESILMEASGGLDSTIVAACLQGLETPLVCGTLVMPTAGTDERRYSGHVARSLDVELQSLHVDPDAAQFDFPVPLGQFVPAVGLLQQTINVTWEAFEERHNVSSRYSGAGGDTVFCYLKGAAPAADAFRERGLFTGIRAVHHLASLHQCTFWKAARLTLRKLRRVRGHPWARDVSFLHARRLPDTPDEHPWFPMPAGSLPGDRERIIDLIGVQFYKDSTAQGNRRDTRYPLISQPVMQACLKVPAWMWIWGGRDRFVARSAFSDLLPESIFHRRSKGSYANYCGVVYEREKDAMHAYLRDGLLCSQGIVDAAALDTFFAAPMAPRDMSFTRLFDLCMVENWVRRQRETPESLKAAS